MRSVLPGVFHWTTFHEDIGERVHSYCITASHPVIVIDPRVPDEGLGWFREHGTPEHAYLTNRLHYRHADRFEDAFGTKVWCHEAGMHHFRRGDHVQPFRHGDTLPGLVEALAVGALCPEETALYVPHAGGILAFGDAVVRSGRGALEFVSPSLMGEHPADVQRGLRASLRRLLTREFDHLLLAHGAPWIGGAKEALRRLVEREGPTRRAAAAR